MYVGASLIGNARFFLLFYTINTYIARLLYSVG